MGCSRGGLLLAKDALAYLRGLLSDPNVVIVLHNGPYDFAVCCAYDDAHRADCTNCSGCGADESLAAPCDRCGGSGKQEPLINLVFRAYDEGRIRDTQIREMLIDIAAGSLGWAIVNGKNTKKKYSLESLSMQYLGHQLDKGADGWRTRYAELDGVPLEQWPERARKYATDDAIETLDVFFARLGDEVSGFAIPDEQPQVRAAWALHLMSVWGIRTEEVRVNALAAELRVDIAEIRMKLSQAGIFRPSGAKNMAIVEEMVRKAYAAKGLDCPMTPSGKKPSTSAEALEESGDPVLVELGGMSGPSKLLSTYVPALEQGVRVPINARFNALVETGRASCGKPNLMNPPRKGGVRPCFVGRQGWVMATNDYDMAELKSLAQICIWLFGHSDMGEALKLGRDLHLDFAAEILGIIYEEAHARRKEPAIALTRQLAKAPMFGLPGGLGAETLIEFAWANYGIRIPNGRRFVVAEDQEKYNYDSGDDYENGKRGKYVFEEVTPDGQFTAQGLKKRWLKRYAEMKQYFAHINSLVGFEGRATVKQFVSGRYRGGVGYCDGANGFFQGLTADGAKAALYAVSRECYTGEWLKEFDPTKGAWTFERRVSADGTWIPSPLYGARPSVFMHDEIIIEFPKANGDAPAWRLSWVMNFVMQRYIPDIPVTSTPALMRRWHKGAEAVYLKGSLVPWEPHEIHRCACVSVGANDIKEWAAHSRPDCLSCHGTGSLCSQCFCDRNTTDRETHCWKGPKPEGANEKKAA